MGSVRTFTAPVKRMVQQRLREIAHGIAASHGPRCSIVVQFHDGCDSVYFSYQYEIFFISQSIIQVSDKCYSTMYYDSLFFSVCNHSSS